MRFWKILGPISAYEILKPDKIILHCKKKPSGKWWDEMFRIVPIDIDIFDEPVVIFGQPIFEKAHRADVARLQILKKYGGIYLDMDVVVLKSFDDLRIHDCVLGVETGPHKPTFNVTNAGVILAKPDSTFLDMWYEGYRHYNGKCWLCNSGYMPNRIRKKHPNLVHIEPKIWHDTGLNIFKKHINLTGIYAYHMWVYFGMYHHPVPGLNFANLKPENIYKLNNTFGDLIRRFYVNSYDLKQSNSKSISKFGPKQNESKTIRKSVTKQKKS